MNNLIHRLKCRFSEPYCIRRGFGLSPLRSNREYKALIDFCERELLDKDHMKLNPDRRKVYKATLKLNKLNTPEGFWFKTAHSPKMYYNDPHTFIEDHVGWYWN